jgi:hypothetical protein
LAARVCFALRAQTQDAGAKESAIEIYGYSMPFMIGNCVMELVWMLDALKNLPSKISKPENHASLCNKAHT